MPANINSGLSLDDFEDKIKDMFGGTKLTMRFDQIEDNILRVGFRARGMPELVVDLRAGPKTRFGQVVYEVTSSGKEKQMYFYGAEAIGGKEPKEVTFRSAEKAFVNYILGAFREDIPTTYGMTPKERMSYLRTFGYYPTEGKAADYFAAGGVMNINPTVHWGKQLTDLLEGVTVRAKEKWMVNQVIADLWEMGAGIRREMVLHKRIPSLGSVQRMIAEMPGFMQAATAGERGRLVPIPGQLEYDEYGQAVIRGIGPAATIAKREPLYQREVNVHFIMTTPEGKIKVAEPGYITTREAQGWRYPNLTVGGIEPVPMYYQPRVLQIPGVASGAMLLRREAWEGYQASEQERWMEKPEAERVVGGVLQRGRIVSAGFEKGLKLEFPEISVRDLTKIQIIPGFFKRAGPGEYERIADYTERAIPAYTTQIVGLLKFREQGKMITREITATAGATPFYVPEGEDYGMWLSMPQYYSPQTGEAVQFKGRAGRSTIDYADRLLADAKERGFNIARTSSGEITLELRGLMGVAPSLKGFAGGKIVMAPQPQAAYTPTLGIELEDPKTKVRRTEQYWAVTSDVKLATEWFTWSVFAGLPNAQQEQMLRQLEEADPSKRGAVNAMIAYMRNLPLVGGKTRIPDLNILAEIFSKQTHRPAIMAGFELMEELRQTVMRMDPATSMARYQVALLPAEWRQVGEHAAGERKFLETKYKAAFGPDWRNYARLEPVPGDPRRVMESYYAWSVLGPVGSTLTTEFMSQDPRINLAGMRSLPEDIARQLDIAPGLDVMGTGMAPKAARAWRGVVDAVSWWKSKMAKPPDYTLVNRKYGEPYDIVTLEDLRLAGIRSEIGPRSTPRQISKIITEKMKREPEMVVLPNNEIFPLPRLIDPLATYHYGMEEGTEQAISRMGRGYARALIDVMTFGTVSPMAPMRNAAAKWLEDVNRVVESGKEVYKITTGATTEAMAGGRYIYTQGTPFNVGIISEATLQAALERKAAKLGIENRAEWMESIHRKIRGWGGIPSLTIREPNVWEKYGAVPSMLVTPELLRQKYGLEFPEGTQVRGFRSQQIIGGNPFFTGVLGALGYMTVGQQGDWDMDQMLAIMGFRITKKGIVATKKMLSLATQDSEQLMKFVLEGGPETVGTVKNEFGIDVTAFDVILKQLADVKEGLLPGMKWETSPTTGQRIQVPTSPEITYGAAVQEESRLRAISKAGMARAHIMRTWLTAGAIAMGMSEERVQETITGTSNPYQKYLDYMTKEIKARGGFTAVENLFSTSVFSYDSQTKVLSIYGMHRGDKGFARIASSYASYDMRDKPMQQGTFALGITEALVWALQESGYTNKSLSFLIAQTPEMQSEIYNRLKAGTKLANIVLPGTSGNIWSRGEFDITKTPIGVAYLSAIIQRNVRPGKEKVSIIGRDAEGNDITVPIQQIAAHEPFFWQGKTIPFGELIKDPGYLATSAIVQALTNQGGSLTPEQGAVIIQLQRAYKQQGLKVPKVIKQIAGRYPVGEAYDQVMAEKFSAEETLDEMVKNSLIGMRDKGKMTVRASSLPYYSIEEYEQAGYIYGKKGKATWEQVKRETRLKLFMQRVMNIGEEDLDLIFPKSAQAMRVIAQGEEFERQYVAEEIGDWGRTTISGIERRGKGMSHAEISMKQLAQYGPVASIFRDLITELPGIEEWAITGIPDIMRISESGEAIIEEVKQIGNYGATGSESSIQRRERESLLRRTKAMSDQVRIQLASYLLGGLATASVGKKAFREWITPLIESSREYGAVPFEERGKYTNQTVTRMYKAFRSGAKGIETIGVRGVEGAESIAAITGEDLRGLALLVAEGMRKVYTTWTDQGAAKALFVEAITAIRDSGVNVDLKLQRLIEEYPLETRVPEERERMDIRAKVKPGRRKTTAEPEGLEPLAEQIRKDPFIAIEAYFKSRPTPFSEAERLVGTALEQVNLARELHVLDMPLKMYQQLMASRGVTVETLPDDQKMRDVFMGASLAEKGMLVRKFSSELTQGSKAWAATLTATTRAGIHSNIQGMEELSNIINLTTPSLAPGKQLGMGETLQLSRELQPLLATVNALNKSFQTFDKEAGVASTKMAELAKKVGDVTERIEGGKVKPGSAEEAALVAQRAALGAEWKVEKIRFARAQYGQMMLDLAGQPGREEDLLAAAEADAQLSKAERAATGQWEKEREGAGITAREARPISKAARLFRNFIGGWGLFYMGTLASWPARAMAYGLEEQEGMRAQITQALGGYLGTDQVMPFQQVGFDVMRSKMVSNAGGAAYAQWLSSQMPGVARQVAGIGMGAAAGAAFATFGLQAAEGVLGREWVMKYGGPITAAASIAGGLGAIALNVAGNIRNPEQAAVSAAADRMKFGDFIGEISQGINLGIPQETRVWQYYSKRPFGMGEMMVNTFAATMLKLKQNAGLALSPTEEKMLTGLQSLQNQVVGQAWGFSAINASDLLEAATNEFLGQPTSLKATQQREYDRVKAAYTASGKQMFQDQFVGMVPLIANNPRFSRYDPTIVAQAAVRAYAQGFYGAEAADRIEQIAKADTMGIPTEQIGAMYAQTFRKPYTASVAREAESWALRNVTDRFDAARKPMVLDWMSRLPLSFIKSTLAPGTGAGWEDVAYRRAEQIALTPVGGMVQEFGVQAAQAELMGMPAATMNLIALQNALNPQAAMQYAFRQLRQQSLANAINSAAVDAGVQGTALNKIYTMVQTGSSVQTAQANRMVGMAQNLSALGFDPNNFNLQSYMTTEGSYLGNLQTSVGATLQQQLGTFTGQQAFQEWMKPGGPLYTIGAAQATSQIFQQNPVRLTQLANNLPPTNFAYRFSLGYAPGDISGRTGRPTGLAWGATGIGRGNIPAVPDRFGGPSMAEYIWGRGWAGGQVSGAMAGGYPSPYGEQLYGEEAYQQMTSDLGFEYNTQMLAFQQQRLDVQNQYIPQFRAIEDRMVTAQYNQAMRGFGLARAAVGVQVAQIQLGHRQFLEQYGLQQEQFALQGRQFYAQQAMAQAQFARGQALQVSQFGENLAINQRQAFMQRGWTQQDWAFQGQVREMQWGWRQQDFQESVRFMTGRERRLAERQMERETVMHTVEGDQIERQKARQKEIWKLEDERFALQKKQFVEQIELQKRNFTEGQELQRRFFEEQRALQEKAMEMQKRHEEERYRLSLAAAGVQMAQIQAAEDAYKENFELQEELRLKQREYQDKLRENEQIQLDYQKGWAEDQKTREDEYLQFLRTRNELEGQVNLNMQDLETYINNAATAITLMKGQVDLLQNKVNSFSWAAFWRGLIGGKSEDAGGKQTGFIQTVPPGFMNDSYVVRASTGETVMVFPTDKGIRPTQNWNNIVGNMYTYPNSSNSFGGGTGGTILIINIGNERLGRFVIRHVNQELEV